VSLQLARRLWRHICCCTDRRSAGPERAAPSAAGPQPLPGNESHPVAADAIGSLLARKPDAVLGLATGSSPLAIYDELTNRCADGTVTYARAKVLACRTYETSARPTAP